MYLTDIHILRPFQMCKVLLQLAQQQGSAVTTRCCDTPLCNTNPYATNNAVGEIGVRLTDII